MANQSGSARLVYGLSCLVTLLIATFAAVAIVQHRWSAQIQRKHEQNRLKIESLQTQCAEKMLQDAILLRFGTEHNKRQTGSLQQMLQEMMAAQERVLLSHCLNSTSLCDKGQKGPPGLKGDIGVHGTDGQKGTKGTLGPKGNIGLPGPKGVKGDTGLPGDDGTNGTRGLRGLRGPKGYNGTAGQQGPAGKQGVSGTKGDKGDAGLRGTIGPKGSPGQNGTKGAKGDPGLVGSKGDLGPPGPPGPAGIDLQKDCMCIRKPVIDIFQPSQETVSYPIGANVNLTCDSTSSPKPTIMWYLPDDNCTGSQAVANSALNLTSLQPSQLGVYRCEATNKYGTTSKTFTIQSNLVGALDCDFEKPCLWENDRTDRGDWSLRHGATQTSGTGPSLDHTLGTSRGYYMYTDSYSGSTRVGNRVHLLSPELGTSGPVCLSFWYHMYGANEGSLLVERLNTCNNTRYSSHYFSTSGNKSDLWHPASVQIPAIQENHKLVITSKQGSGVRSDVAIDDIKYYAGKCTPMMSRTGAAVRNITVSAGQRLDLNCGIEGSPKPSYAWKTADGCVTSNQASDAMLHVTDFASSGNEGTYTCTASGPGVTPLTTTYNVNVTGSTGNCDLEHGLCGWTQDKNDIFDWGLLSGPTGSKETGPSNDHTRNSSSGQYLYIEASSPRTLGHDAVLRSPLIKGQQDACFSLYYNMYGLDMGNLTVMLQDNCTNQTTELFKMSGNKGQPWLYRAVNISAGSVPNNYNILIRGTIGAGFHGDIAIDDLEIDNDACGAFNSFEFDCTFDKDLCKWAQSSSDDFNWTRLTGSTPSTGTGPSGDHTNSKGSGYYLYTEASSTTQGQKADLLSPVLPAGQDFCFHIATNLYGTSMGRIRILTKEEGLGGRTSQIASYTGGTSPLWSTHKVHVSPQPGPFRIVIEGVAGSSFSSDAAVDDVSLTQGSC